MKRPAYEHAFGKDIKEPKKLSECNAEEMILARIAWLADNFHYASYTQAQEIVCNAIDYIKSIGKELNGLRAFKRSVDEALNSGDGSYRP